MSSTLAKDKVTENALTQTDIRLKYLFEQGVDFKNRSIVIDGIIDEGDFTRVDAALSELENDSRKAVTIKINSPGGSVYDAMAIVGRLRASKCHIVTEGYGHIMSAAMLVLACGDRRRMSRYAWGMTHEASYEVEGAHSQVKEAIIQAEREEQRWVHAMEQFTGIPTKDWNEKHYKTNAYFSPEECLELNIVDELI